MFFIHNVFWVDSTINIGIIVSNDINGDSFNILTRPSTWAFIDIEWTVTIDITVIWAVFISPSVFNIDNTLVDFTSINNFITIVVTIHIEFI